MTIVLDVSAVIQIILKKEKEYVFKEKLKQCSWVLAPDIYVSELTNTMWKYYRTGVIDHEESLQYVEDGLLLVDDLIPASDLWKESLGESIKNNHPVYDMLYMVTARRNGSLIITNDGRLAEICKAQKIPVLI